MFRSKVICVRSSRPDAFCKKVFLKILQNLQENTFESEACNFIKKENLAQVFSSEFCEVFKNTFFIERLWWLLLLCPRSLLAQVIKSLRNIQGCQNVFKKPIITGNLKNSTVVDTENSRSRCRFPKMG